MTCGTDMPVGRCGAPWEVTAQRLSSTSTSAVAPALTVPRTKAVRAQDYMAS
jgi:hypothetical protein